MEGFTDCGGINILQLPVEVLTEIVSYVDIRSRRSLGPVCKDFYEILSRLEKDKFQLVLTYSQVMFACSVSPT